MKLISPYSTATRLGPIHPSAGVRAWYERELCRLIDVMTDAVSHALVPIYNRAAQHGHVLPLTFPFGELDTALDEVMAEQQRLFDDAAFILAYGATWRALRHHDLAMWGAL
jgi:hypothetical protein